MFVLLLVVIFGSTWQYIGNFHVLCIVVFALPTLQNYYHSQRKIVHKDKYINSYVIWISIQTIHMLYMLCRA
jgi:hypothetical protein